MSEDLSSIDATLHRGGAGATEARRAVLDLVAVLEAGSGAYTAELASTLRPILEIRDPSLRVTAFIELLDGAVYPLFVAIKSVARQTGAMPLDVIHALEAEINKTIEDAI